MKALLLTALLAGLFVAGLAGAVAATGWAESAAALARLGGAEIALLLLLSLANYGARALRWHLLGRAIGLPTRLGQDLRHYLGGFALTATPGRVGEFVRLRWLLGETGWTLVRTAPLALADRAAELASVGLLLVLAVLLSQVDPALSLPLAALVLALAWVSTRPGFVRAAVTLAWRTTGVLPRLHARGRQVARGLSPFTRGRVALPALLLGAAGWFAEGLALWLLLGWLGVPVPLWTAVAIFLLANTSGALAGLPGGLGGTEAAMVGLLLLQGVPAAVAIPATAVIRLTTLWFAILIGLGVFPLAEARARRAGAGAA